MGHVVTGVRTSGVAGMPGPWSPRTDGQPPRATVPRNGGHQPKDWQALLFNTVGDHEFFLAFGKCVSEVVTWKFYFGLGAWYACNCAPLDGSFPAPRLLSSPRFLPARGSW